MAATPAALSGMTEEVQSFILTFLTGWEAAGVSAAFRPWRRMLQSGSWWRGRCIAEFGTAPPESCPSDTAESCCRYRDFLGAYHAKVGTWCHRSQRHGLGRRVAQPQLFVGPKGARLFSYGGWTDYGPVNDLHSVPLVEFLRAVDAGREEGVHFCEVRASGSPATEAGVQTLTPLWYGDREEDRPSMRLLGEVAAESPDRAERADRAPDGLLLAFGGALGGYRNEQRSWAVGLLHEASASRPPCVEWLRPQPGRPRSGGGGPAQEGAAALPMPRGAHTATFVPSRLVDPDRFPEGCVVVFGGHTHHCTVELARLDVLALHKWQWTPDVQATGLPPAARHGHSANLIEVDGRGFLLIAGGGTGNILGTGLELSGVAVLDLRSWCWVGSLELGPHLRDLPVPGRHHSASLGLRGQVYIFGGGDQPSNRMCVLDGEECVRRARAAAARAAAEEAEPQAPLLRGVPVPDAGQQPRARKMHGAACLLPWAPYCVILGGWETGPHFNDLWVLRLGSGSSALPVPEADPDSSDESSDSEIDGIMNGVLRMPPQFLDWMWRTTEGLDGVGGGSQSE